MDSALITKTDIIDDHIVNYAGSYVQRSVVDFGFIYSGSESFYSNQYMDLAPDPTLKRLYQLEKTPLIVYNIRVEQDINSFLRKYKIKLYIFWLKNFASGCKQAGRLPRPRAISKERKKPPIIARGFTIFMEGWEYDISWFSN